MLSACRTRTRTFVARCRRRCTSPPVGLLPRLRRATLGRQILGTRHRSIRPLLCQDTRGRRARRRRRRRRRRRHLPYQLRAAAVWLLAPPPKTSRWLGHSGLRSRLRSRLRRPAGLLRHRRHPLSSGTLGPAAGRRAIASRRRPCRLRPSPSPRLRQRNSPPLWRRPSRRPQSTLPPPAPRADTRRPLRPPTSPSLPARPSAAPRTRICRGRCATPSPPPIRAPTSAAPWPALRRSLPSRRRRLRRPRAGARRRSSSPMRCSSRRESRATDRELGALGRRRQRRRRRRRRRRLRRIRMPRLPPPHSLPFLLRRPLRRPSLHLPRHPPWRRASEPSRRRRLRRPPRLRDQISRPGSVRPTLPPHASMPAARLLPSRGRRRAQCRSRRRRRRQSRSQSRKRPRAQRNPQRILSLPPRPRMALTVRWPIQIQTCRRWRSGCPRRSARRSRHRRRHLPRSRRNPRSSRSPNRLGVTWRGSRRGGGAT